MKKIKIKKWHFYLAFGVLALLIFVRISALNNPTIDARSQRSDEIVNLPDEILKSSGFWDLTEIISIDDDATGVDAHNWTWAVSQAWCSGAGIYGDPFLIENVTITIDTGDAGISIVNSNSTTYFTLNNVTIVNTDADGSGILLNGTYNGQILDSICNSMADSGLKLITSNNLTIDGNTVNQNAYGIYMDNVTTTTISANTIINNTNTGIYGINCTYNTIGTLNDLTDNNLYGIYLEDSDENDINQNYVRSGNNTGIAIYDSDNCTVYYNTIAINIGIGLLIDEDDGNSLTNTIYRNDFDGNGVNGNDSCAVANSWDNGSLGNDWSNYPYYDGNDDGIGDIAYTVPGTAGATDRYPIFDDGTEPIVTLSDDDDVDELFADEKNREVEINWYLIGGIIAITGGIIAGGYVLIKKKIISPRKMKGRIKTAAKKVKSPTRIKKRRSKARVRRR